MQSILKFPASEHADVGLSAHYGMMHYHMGWANASLHAETIQTGKRLRPIFCLLACEAVDGSPQDALPAASAIEILHNFSLVHDDIEDGDETRHHRTTMWKLWGIPLTINTGDAMFAMAYSALHRLPRMGVNADITLRAFEIFTKANIELTEGQHLDMQFEHQSDVQLADYFRMIEGKTAALIGCATAIGALIGRGSPAQVEAMKRFGQCLGLAFQIQDDVLGIWGDPEVTGKAVGNDILRQKKSLPLLHALNHERIGPKLKTLMAGGLSENQLSRVMDLLADAGSRQLAEEQQRFYHETSLSALREAVSAPMQTTKLVALANSLLDRAT